MDKRKISSSIAKIMAIFFASVLVTTILAVLLNPALSKLESILKLELTGHSGPSGKVLLVIFSLSFAILALVWRNWKNKQ